MPFTIIGAVVLPENLHFIWQVPPRDSAYSKRIGKTKVLFTQSLLENYLNYIDYNPVKHNLVSCSHLWQYSSFHSWVKNRVLEYNWGCVCNRLNN